MKQQNNHTPQTGLSYYRLSLLSFLKESHPELLSDIDLITARADEAAEIYSDAIKEGLSHTEAEEMANLVLFRGLLFSGHDTIINILWNEFAGIIPQSGAKDFAIRIRPECEAVFARYALSDEFIYSPGYDKLYTELTGFIDLWLEEHECFEQREQSQAGLNYAESRKTPIEDEL